MFVYTIFIFYKVLGYSQRTYREEHTKITSATRWKSRVNSVKATRYQAPQVRDALVSMAEAFDVQR